MRAPGCHCLALLHAAAAAAAAAPALRAGKDHSKVLDEQLSAFMDKAKQASSKVRLAAQQQMQQMQPQLACHCVRRCRAPLPPSPRTLPRSCAKTSSRSSKSCKRRKRCSGRPKSSGRASKPGRSGPCSSDRQLQTRTQQLTARCSPHPGAAAADAQQQGRQPRPPPHASMACVRSWRPPSVAPGGTRTRAAGHASPSLQLQRQH